MIRALATILGGLALIAAAPDPGAAMRGVWQTQKAASATAVVRVYNRVVVVELPRPFVAVSRAERGNFFIMEFVPDGQTVDDWTAMITITGTRGQGTARFTDAELAAQFQPQCPGQVFHDLAATPPMPEVTGRFVVIGCGAADTPGSERGALAVLHDAANSWTVQYAERNHGRPLFTHSAALARIEALRPQVVPDDGTGMARFAQ